MSADGGLAEALTTLVEHIGGSPRPGQARMADAVAQAMRDRRHLIVQAGTGTGKSFAYLLPAALRSVGSEERILVSTATLALQRQLISKDIPVVLDAIGPALPRRPAVAVVKGRSNYVCQLRLAESADVPRGDALFDLPGRLEQQGQMLRDWAAETDTGDRDDLAEPVDARVWRALSVSGRECVGRQRCPVGDSCFAEVARDRAAAADLVVANHTVLAIDLAGEADLLPDYDVAIIDEAHELVARVTQASTQSLTAPGLGESARLGSGLLTEQVLQRWRDAASGFEAALTGDVPGQGSDRRLPRLPQGMVRSLAEVRDGAYAALSELASGGDGDTVSRRQAAAASFTEAHDLAGLLLRDDAEVVRWMTEDPAGLSCAPLAVSGRLRSGLFDERTVIATSATMRLGGAFRTMAAGWGLPGAGEELAAEPEAAAGSAGTAEAEAADDRGTAASSQWAHLDVGSPFDYQRQSILYVAGDLPAPGREAVAGATLSRIASLVRAAGGRTLVLAASWRSADAIVEHLRDVAVPGVTLLYQERGVPVGPLVAKFASDERSVLVGTLSLWQGVDIPGAACSCVILDKVPFPRPDDPVLAARSEAAAAEGRSGFAAVALPHAALLLAQGAGRLIRDTEDRGVVAILDSRLARRSYGTFLLDSLPAMWRTSNTDIVLAALRRLAERSDAP